MERDTLSFQMLGALLWAALLGPAAELLPGEAGALGLGGGLLVFLSGAVMAAAGAAVGRLVRVYGSYARAIPGVFGPRWGRGLLFLYIMWYEGLLVLRLAQAGRRLEAVGGREGPAWLFPLVLGALALWMARGKLAALGRAGQLMFLALSFTAGAVLVLAAFRVRGENLLPVWEWNLQNAAAGVWPGLEVLGYGSFALFLAEGNGEKDAGPWLWWTALGCAALAAAQWIMVGNFGPRLTGELKSPFFQLAQSVGVEGAFQRVESLVAGVWTFSDLLLLAGLLWGIRRAGAALWPKITPAGVVTAALLPALGAAAALSGGLFPIPAGWGVLVPLGNLLLGAGVPALAYFLKRGRGAHKSRGTSCG